MPSFNWKSPQRPWVTQSLKDQDSSKGRSPHAYDRRYKSKRWRLTRLNILEQTPLCHNCQSTGRITPARVIDHIIPVRQGGAFFDPNNLQPLCDSCHNSKSGSEGHSGGGRGVQHHRSKISRNVEERTLFDVNNLKGES